MTTVEKLDWKRPKIVPTGWKVSADSQTKCAGIFTIQPRKVPSLKDRIFKKARRCRRYLQGPWSLPAGWKTRTGK